MIYLVRYAEIALKGKNRTEFEKKLVENIKICLKTQKREFKIKRSQGRLLVETEEHIDLRKVFGIVSYSPCMRVKADLENICSEALKIAAKYPKTTTFRISTRRITKELSQSSVELNNEIGSFIVEKTGLKVKLDNPDLDIGIEIIGEDAFVFNKTIPCFGGLPVGIEGKVLVLIDNENPDHSLLAALLMMKRGCSIETGSVLDTNHTDFTLLQAYAHNNIVLYKIKNFAELHELASKLNCKAIVVDDTLKNLKDYPMNLLVLRPLIAFSEQEIKPELEKYKGVM